VSDRFGIPAELRERRQWVVWRHENRHGKQTKVPYKANAPRERASTTDVSTWSPFERAAAVVASGRGDGPGFVFADSDPFAGVDLDGCRSKTGELNAEAAAIVEALDSYTEASPSGRGVHVIVRGRLDGGRCRRGPVEIYDRGRYFAMTGERLPGVPHTPMPRQRQLDELRARLFPPPRPRVHDFRPLDVTDEELIRRACQARNGAVFERLWRGDIDGYPSRSEADMALCGLLAFWAGGDPDRIDRLFRRSGLMRDKWERADYRGRTIGKAIGP
jgi:putative DNA primase/helicase